MASELEEEIVKRRQATDRESEEGPEASHGH